MHRSGYSLDLTACDGEHLSSYWWSNFVAVGENRFVHERNGTSNLVGCIRERVDFKYVSLEARLQL